MRMGFTMLEQELIAAVRLALPILQEDRDAVVECGTVAGDLSTLDEGTAEWVERYDAAISALNAASGATVEARPLPEPIASAEPGLYRVHWSEGGSSLAAIGMNPDGSRWLAPTNWVAPATKCGPNPWWHAVSSLEPIDTAWRPLPDLAAVPGGGQ